MFRPVENNNIVTAFALDLAKAGMVWRAEKAAEVLAKEGIDIATKENVVVLGKGGVFGAAIGEIGAIAKQAATGTADPPLHGEVTQDLGRARPALAASATAVVRLFARRLDAGVGCRRAACSQGRLSGERSH